MRAKVLHLQVARPSGAYGQSLGDVTPYATSATGHVRELARQLGVTPVELIGPAATRAAAATAIGDARHALRGDDPGLFVLSFAGHGGKIEDTDGDEVIDLQDEAWGLDDDPLVDDELVFLLRDFPGNITVAILSNCCFAGGLDDAIARTSLDESLFARGICDAAAREAAVENLLGGARARGIDSAAVGISPAEALAARRASWHAAVTRIGQDRLFAPLAPARAPRPGAPRTLARRGAARAAASRKAAQPRKRVLAAVCQVDQTFLAPPTSVFSSTILDTVFPSGQDGIRQRAPDITYERVGRALETIAGLPLFARPSVTGPAAVLDKPAFVPT